MTAKLNCSQLPLQIQILPRWETLVYYRQVSSDIFAK